ncbi:MAG: TolC family protein [Planctomycetes bacterium]|nr:TolC family protein [Planctomycetota bacterium]
MKKKILIFLMAAAASTLVQAAEEMVLDIDTAVKLALENNLALQSEKIDLGIKKRAMDRAWNVFIPDLKAGISLTRMNEEITVMPPGEPYYWTLSASVQANFPLSMSIAPGIRNTVLEYQAGAISLEGAEKKLNREVRKSFLRLLLLEENIRLLEQNIKTASRRYEQAKINYENGLVPELTMLSSRVALENLKPALENAKIAFRSAVLQFKQMLGIDRQTNIIITGSIEAERLSFEAETLIKKYPSGRLDVQSLIKSIQILENSKQLALNTGLTPVLSFTYSYNPGLSDPFNTDWGIGGNWSDKGMFGIGLTLPLDGFIPYSKTNNSIQDLEDNIEKTRLALAQTLRLAEMEIESIVMGINKSARALEVLDFNVKLAQKAYDLAEEAYKAGAADLLEVESANDELQKAKLEVLNEKYNYQAGLLDLEYALNTTLEEVRRNHEKE